MRDYIVQGLFYSFETLKEVRYFINTLLVDPIDYTLFEVLKEKLYQIDIKRKLDETSVSTLLDLKLTPKALLLLETPYEWALKIKEEIIMDYKFNI